MFYSLRLTHELQWNRLSFFLLFYFLFSNTGPHDTRAPRLHDDTSRDVEAKRTRVDRCARSRYMVTRRVSWLSQGCRRYDRARGVDGMSTRGRRGGGVGDVGAGRRVLHADRATTGGLCGGEARVRFVNARVTFPVVASARNRIRPPRGDRISRRDARATGRTHAVRSHAHTYAISSWGSRVCVVRYGGRGAREWIAAAVCVFFVRRIDQWRRHLKRPGRERTATVLR